eukprot:6185624-Pleurochrysis_carterae.AAC.1
MSNSERAMLSSTERAVFEQYRTRAPPQARRASPRPSQQPAHSFLTAGRFVKSTRSCGVARRRLGQRRAD